MLKALHEQITKGESLQICCSACQKECINRFDNNMIKKFYEQINSEFIGITIQNTTNQTVDTI